MSFLRLRSVLELLPKARLLELSRELAEAPLPGVTVARVATGMNVGV